MAANAYSGTYMKIFVACIALTLCTMGLDCRADTKEIEETLSVVWEGFWQQTGYPQRVFKWQGPIRVKFSGPSSNRDREFALTQLRQVANIAGIEVSESGNGAADANLEVEFTRSNPVSRRDPCRTFRKTSEGVILSTKITVPESAARRCLLHEAMHAMGISGHPHGNSILSYFPSSKELTGIDKFFLKVLYSEQIKGEVYLFRALQIFAQRLIESVPEGEARIEAERITAHFLRARIKQMESFALAKGEPPRIILQSSTSTASGLEKGRIEGKFLLGLAYMFGDVVEANEKKGFDLLAEAASSSHREAQLFLGDAYSKGAGVEQNLVEAYKWYLLAARKGLPRAKAEAKKLEGILAPRQVSEGKEKAKAKAWKPSTKEMPSPPTTSASAAKD